MARIFGSEEDRVNCPFYFKMGACRHGDQSATRAERVRHHWPLVEIVMCFDGISFVFEMLYCVSTESRGIRKVGSQKQKFVEVHLDEKFRNLV